MTPVECPQTNKHTNTHTYKKHTYWVKTEETFFLPPSFLYSIFFCSSLKVRKDGFQYQQQGNKVYVFSLNLRSTIPSLNWRRNEIENDEIKHQECMSTIVCKCHRTHKWMFWHYFTTKTGENHHNPPIESGLMKCQLNDKSPSLADCLDNCYVRFAKLTFNVQRSRHLTIHNIW